MKWNIFHKGTVDYLGTAHGETEAEAIQNFLRLRDTHFKPWEIEARPRDDEGRGR